MYNNIKGLFYNEFLWHDYGTPSVKYLTVTVLEFFISVVNCVEMISVKYKKMTFRFSLCSVYIVYWLCDSNNEH